MRILQFRAWDTLDKKFLWPWPKGFNILGEVTCFDLINQQLSKSPHDRKSSLERLNNVIIMQYTGLHDKHGKEIYEGDILKTYPILASDKIGEQTFNVEVIFKGSCWIANGILGEYQCRISEVIGNKFENPELLPD